MLIDDYKSLREDGIQINHFIYDDAGQVYTIEGNLSASSLISHVCSKKDVIGQINWRMPRPDEIVIGDLIIFDPPLYFKKWWQRLPFLDRRPVTFRGRGLGSAMLAYVLDSARSMDVSLIRGWITSDDLAITSYLPDFYRSRGFTVNEDLSFYQRLT
ncbi:MAG: hypothetical protein H6670_10945 [Anaerolineaceae bacterium]|nr:hypothetical protein [Anaerolineaceae bacterium]